MFARGTKAGSSHSFLPRIPEMVSVNYGLTNPDSDPQHLPQRERLDSTSGDNSEAAESKEAEEAQQQQQQQQQQRRRRWQQQQQL